MLKPLIEDFISDYITSRWKQEQVSAEVPNISTMFYYFNLLQKRPEKLLSDSFGEFQVNSQTLRDQFQREKKYWNIFVIFLISYQRYFTRSQDARLGFQHSNCIKKEIFYFLIKSFLLGFLGFFGCFIFNNYVDNKFWLFKFIDNFSFIARHFLWSS